MKTRCLFFRLIPLSNQIFLLLWCQISTTKLVTANPSNGGIAVRKLLFKDCVFDFRMCLNNTKAIMTIYDAAVPDNQRIQHNAVLENIFFQQLIFFLSQRWNFRLELWVNPQ